MLGNVALTKQPAGSEEMLSVIEQVTAAVALSDNIPAIANLMLDLAVTYAGAEKGSFLLLDESGELRVCAARGMDFASSRNYRIQVGEGIAGRVALLCEPVLVDDIDRDERFRDLKRNRYLSRSFISCPVLSGKKLLGVLNVNDKRSGSFSDNEFALIRTIAGQAAVAVENASLVKKLRLGSVALRETGKKLVEDEIVRTEFLMRMSHELRTPLNSINGAIFYLRKTPHISPVEQHEFCSIISTETTKLIGIVENLLTFLRADGEKHTPRSDFLNIAALVRDVTSSAALAARLLPLNAAVVVDADQPVGDIVGDRMLVVHLLINLLEGLLSYVEQGDTVKIGIRETDFVSVYITLARRLPEIDLCYLFTPSDQEERLKLNLAWKAAESLGWAIRAENTADTCLVSLIIPGSSRQKNEAMADMFLDHYLDCVSEILDVEACSVMLADEMTGELVLRAAKGQNSEAIRRVRINVGERIAGWVAREGKPVMIEDIENDPLFGGRRSARYSTKSLLSVPLKSRGRVIGVLNLNHKRSARPFTRQDFLVASVLAERLTSFLAGLAFAEIRGGFSRQHAAPFEDLLRALRRYPKKSDNMTGLVLEIMEQLGSGDIENMKACYAALVYDLGLSALDESVMQKKTLLPSETLCLKAHPYTTVSLLEGFESSADVKRAILHHHEAYDGSGYPCGLRGEQIPLISRVLAVADSFCAMTAGRPYRPEPFTRLDALGEIRKNSGSMYDPNIVAVLDRLVGAS